MSSCQLTQSKLRGSSSLRLELVWMSRPLRDIEKAWDGLCLGVWCDTEGYYERTVSQRELARADLLPSFLFWFRSFLASFSRAVQGVSRSLLPSLLPQGTSLTPLTPPSFHSVSPNQSILLSILTVLQFLYLVVYMPYVKGVVPNCEPYFSSISRLSPTDLSSDQSGERDGSS